MTPSIGAVVLDLADVLIEFRGAESIYRLSDGRIGAAEFGQFWSSQPADDLYKGRCSPEDFAASAVAAFRLRIGPAEFLREFQTWLRGPFSGAFELVEEVRKRAVVACLSNTNSLDVARFRNELRLEERFDRCFFSNEIGLRKPDPACYAYVLDALGFANAPGRVVFFDDSASAVDVALALGMQAHQVTSVASLRGHLESLGLLGSATH